MPTLRNRPSLSPCFFIFSIFSRTISISLSVFTLCGDQIHRWISKVAKLFAMQTWTCQMFYTRRVTKFFSFTQKKRVNREFFGKIIENGGCFPHLFWTEFQFLCNYLLQVFCENSSLNSANFTERVFFRISSQKYSYTSAIRDKFCVCCNIIFFENHTFEV